METEQARFGKEIFLLNRDYKLLVRGPYPLCRHISFNSYNVLWAQHASGLI